jgi:two-component system, OmpR family, phosphate regulon response regulator PhoB
MKKVLIVEDQPDILEVIHITLEMDNFELHSAADGEAALSMAQRLRPDLVLSDVMMPRMDGLQLCKRIKAESALRKTKVILLSARGQSEDRRVGLAAGADAYLTKPYSPLQLLETVRQVLR